MFEIEITVDGMFEEPASQILTEAGAEGCAIYAESEPLSEDELWDDMNFDLPEGMCKVVGYINSDNIDKKVDEIKNRIEQFKNFGIDFKDYAIDVREIVDINWAEEHKKYYKTVFIEDIAVVPSWDDEAIKNNKDKKMIILEPGAAFGTGLHETTKMCMKYLNAYVKKGDLVYDIGCGSGILAILASILKADFVVATDIDDVAVSAAKKNIALNNISNISVQKGDLLSVCDKKADVIAANIIAPILKNMIPLTKQFLKDKAVLILSGILADQADDIEKVLTDNKFKILNTVTQGDWTGIAAENEE
ncbi:MAG: 50S ribosomal protein L11 methyltransferase [Eubacteriaceae bacterium]|nr:50S ribosomal protein L11 methyltransferase [Eubacteriaceae bacterium]